MSTDRIEVHPMSVGPQTIGPVEFYCGFFSLGCLVAYAKAHDGGCLGDTFRFRPITPVPAAATLAGLPARVGDHGVYLFSSYVWNHRENVEIARQVKALSPRSLVVFGGPQVPRMTLDVQRFFHDHPFVDLTVRAEGELTLASVLQHIATERIAPGDMTRADFSAIPGLCFRGPDGVVTTPERARERDLSAFPSPYLTGEFDHWLPGRSYMPIETNRGCPYGCTFCDWGAATLSKVHLMSLERVHGEIEFAGRNRIESLGFCDANLGLMPRDVDIMRFVVETKQRYGYPKQVGYTNAKTVKNSLREVIKLAWDAGLIHAGQIATETLDENVLKIIKRKNIPRPDYDALIGFLHEEGIPAATDLMIGLPGQTVSTIKSDLQQYFDRKVKAFLFSTSVMPNAPMAEPGYREQYQIQVDAEGFVESTFSFSKEEFTRMFDLGITYKLLVKVGLARYLVYFMQMDRGVPALDFVEQWMDESAVRPRLYPVSHHVRTSILPDRLAGRSKDWFLLNWTDAQGRLLFNRLDGFYRELLQLYQRAFGADVDGTDVRAVVQAQKAVLPRKGRALPAVVSLEHDVVAYFGALRRAPIIDPRPRNVTPLREHGPGVLTLKEQPPTMSYGHADVDPHGNTLELASDLWI